jgi:hypothetical protein
VRAGRLERCVWCLTASHTTPFARWTPILKDFSRRVSPPTPRFQSSTDRRVVHPVHPARPGFAFFASPFKNSVLRAELDANDVTILRDVPGADGVVRGTLGAKDVATCALLGPAMGRGVLATLLDGRSSKLVNARRVLPTLVPIRPRSRGERCSLRTRLCPAHLSAHPSVSIPTHLDAFQLRF